jgi:hypothetical protein
MEDTEPTVVTNVATLEKAVLSAVIASFTGSQADKSESVLAALTFIYRDKNGEVSRDELREKAVTLADVMGYKGDIDGIVTSIVKEEGRHDD